MDSYNFPLYVLGTLIILMLLCFVVGVPLSIYDTYYVRPIAEERANQYCSDKGFDFYESFSRIGFLSKEPVAIICKYVEQYRNVDLNINKQEVKGE